MRGGFAHVRNKDDVKSVSYCAYEDSKQCV